MKLLQSTIQKTIVPGTVVCFALLAVGILDRPAVSFDESAASAARWEYHTTVVNSLDLQDELDKLAKGGWEVFSVIRHESQLIQEGGTNYIRNTQVSVTAKRRTP